MKFVIMYFILCSVNEKKFDCCFLSYGYCVSVSKKKWEKN